MPASQSHGKDRLQRLHKVGWLNLPMLGFNKDNENVKARGRMHTKAREASRHSSLGSLVSHTRHLQDLNHQHMWKKFWFQKTCSYLDQSCIWDLYTSQRYADSRLTVFHTMAPWVILRSIHTKGEEKFPNGDHEPIEMILVIEVRWTVREKHAQCPRDIPEYGTF